GPGGARSGRAAAAADHRRRLGILEACAALGFYRIDNGKEPDAMEKMVLAGIFALAASTTFAQTGPATSPATDPAGAGGPANLCQELLAFMEAPPPEVAEAPPAPTQAAEEDPA